MITFILDFETRDRLDFFRKVYDLYSTELNYGYKSVFLLKY